jgi:hypothetical protein
MITQPIDAIYPAVAVALAELSDSELLALNMVRLMDMNPRGRSFDYDRVAFLFTDDNGTKMHAVTSQAVAQYVARRLGI